MRGVDASRTQSSVGFAKRAAELAPQKPEMSVRTDGDVDAAFAKGSKIVEASYYVPLLAHATMEPPVAIAEYKDGKVTTWKLESLSPAGLIRQGLKVKTDLKIGGVYSYRISPAWKDPEGMKMGFMRSITVDGKEYVVVEL
mgnify:CR=1 FL=1